MKKIKKIKLCICFLTGALALACLSLGVTATSYASGLTQKLFAGYGVSVGTARTNPDIPDTRKGLLMQAAKSGSYARYRDTVSGPFETEFSFLKSGVAAGLKKLRFTFSEEGTNEAFFLNVRPSSGRVSYSVEYAGKEAGIYYSETGAAVGLTASMNGLGYYAALSGKNTTAVKFDTNTMTVYADNTPIWSFLSENNDGHTIDGPSGKFSVYGVGIEFTEVSGGGGVVLYSVCGQELNDRYLKCDTGAPSVFADVGLNGIFGQAYKIPAPRTYDVYDKSASAVLVTVTNSVGEVLRQPYAAGLEFVPDRAGTYELSYSAADAAGNIGGADFSLNIFKKMPESEFTFGFRMNNDTLGTGSKVDTASAKAKSPMLITGRTVDATVTVRYNGAENIIDGISADAENAFVADKPGKYEILYTAEIYGLRLTKLAATVTASDALPVFDYCRFAEEYSYGDYIDIPALTATLAGQSSAAAAVVRRPDGGSYSVKRLALNQTGAYSVVYRAVFDGRVYERDHSFTVNMTRQSLFSNAHDAEALAGAYPYDQSLKGVIARLKPNTPARFTQEISFSKDGQTDIIDIMAVSPDKNGLRYNKIYLTLRDTADPSNYIRIFINGKSSSSLSYVSAQYGSGYFSAFGENGSIGDAGAEVRHSFSSSDIPDYEAADCSVSLRFDYANKTLLVKNKVGVYSVFADLSDPVFIRRYNGEFSGFSGDKAYLEVAFDYVGRNELVWYDHSIYYNGASILIKSFAGYDFTNQKIEDAAPPVIAVERPQKISPAVVGKPYRVFAASARDGVSGAVPVKARVVYNYGNKNYVDISVSNGMFYPIYEGAYTVLYTATDKSGNTATEIAVVAAYLQEPPVLTATVESRYTADEKKQGLPVRIENLTVEGGAGNYKTAVRVLYGDAEIPNDGEMFLPKLAGEYKIIYSVTDYVGNACAPEYTVTVAANTVPVFEVEVEILPVMTAGEPHKLEKAYALDYSANPATRLEAVIYVQYPGQPDYDAQPINPDAFVPDPSRVSHGDTLAFKYAVEGSGGNNTFERTAKVAEMNMSGGSIDLTKYFTGDGITVTNPGAVSVQAGDGGRALFGKKLLAYGYSLNFMVDESTIRTLTVRLRDWESPRIYIDLKLNIPLRRMTLNGEPSEYSISVSNGTVTLAFNAGARTFSASNTVGDAALANMDALGKKFEGFPCGFVCTEFIFATNGGATNLNITGIANQNINASHQDTVAPVIDVRGDVGGSAVLGSGYTVAAAIAGDVLSKCGQVVVTVKNPSGGFVTAEDGTVLDGAPASGYGIVLNERGIYTVRYAVSDLNGRAARSEVRVLNVKPPLSAEELTVRYAQALPPSVNLGDAVGLAEVLVPDGKSYTVIVNVFDSDGSIADKTEDNTFKAAKPGKYTVRYTVYDDTGNLKIENFYITVA
jgi:hypothetical protein